MGAFKPTGFQTLVIDDQPTTLPVKDLYRVPRAVHEDENLTAQRVAPHLGTDHTGQGVKALAHIGRAGEQVILKVTGQGEHYR